MRFTLPSTLTVIALAVLLSGCFSTQQRANEYVENRWELPAKEKRAVKDGRVYVGMKSESVIAAIGYPSDRNVTHTKNGKREQWVYQMGYDRAYVYVKGGEVVGIQENGYNITSR